MPPEVTLYGDRISEKRCHFVACVTCSKKTQITRLLARPAMTEKKALAIVKAQRTIAEKKRLSDFVISTDTSLEKTQKSVLAVISKMKKKVPFYA